MDAFEFDRQFSSVRLAGVDEAGRGPLAGPVVAAAVILPSGPFINGLNDSKAVSHEQREAVFQDIVECADDFYIAVVEPDEIDRLNILQASLKAMGTALSNLTPPPDLILVDGNQKPKFSPNERAIIKGDAKSASIMAASILAKVTRDHMMIELDRSYPQYGFRINKGYGSAEHLAALKKYGPCPAHRKSFEPVRSLLSPQLSF